jgi:hypothetical protein
VSLVAYLHRRAFQTWTDASQTRRRQA